jgi:hypothetical protein
VTSVSAPYSVDSDPDPAFLAEYPDPGFDNQKLAKIYSWKKRFFDQKLQFTCTYP